MQMPAFFVALISDTIKGLCAPRVRDCEGLGRGTLCRPKWPLAQMTNFFASPSGRMSSYSSNG